MSTSELDARLRRGLGRVDRRPRRRPGVVGLMRRGDVVSIDSNVMTATAVSVANERWPAVVVSNDGANRTARRLGHGAVTVRTDHGSRALARIRFRSCCPAGSCGLPQASHGTCGADPIRGDRTRARGPRSRSGRSASSRSRRRSRCDLGLRFECGVVSEPASTRIALIRHGETKWSLQRRHTGRTDIPLDDAGRRKADRAAAGRSPDVPGIEDAVVYVSPLRRARDTADAGRGRRTTPTCATTCWSGTTAMYEGRRTSDIRRTIPGWSVWTHPIVGGETMAAGRRAGRPGDRPRRRACRPDRDVRPRPRAADPRRPLVRATARAAARSSRSMRPACPCWGTSERSR